MYDDDKYLYIITIKGELEEIEKPGKDIYGNLEYSLFDFQIKIEKFVTDLKDNKEIEIEIQKPELEKKIKIDENNNNGIYSIYLASNIYNVEN